ncbi:PX protein [Geosmithia morbida]|uniref:PX protein n=1 Tax=Geosmithia morbida TaxID=1094350 RepID=A0A9P5D6M4_9HYPO|nr:PX protein [Geosmithia morbida]KAF4124910.1 PX protein [Geosmithia morbida]
MPATSQPAGWRQPVDQDSGADAVGNPDDDVQATGGSGSSSSSSSSSSNRDGLPLSPGSAVTTPPYWTANKSDNNGHQRTPSNQSSDSLPAGAITLRDNETLEDDDRNTACWARSVEIVDHIVVGGSTISNIGAFVVWIIRVETLTGSYMNIRKRYSEFDDFRHRLIVTFPNFETTIPSLPPKSVISKFQPRFLERRRAAVYY